MIKLAIEQFAQILFLSDWSALEMWQQSLVLLFSLSLVWAFLSSLWRLFKRIFRLG